MQKTISILGSTGSIGTQTLAVLKAHHPEFQIGYLTTNTNVELLAKQVREVRVQGVAIADEAAAKRFKDLSDFRGNVLVGQDGVCEAAASAENTIVMSALVGFSGVLPTLAAIRESKTIALANKETLVSAGELITTEARKSGSTIIAVDSEHSAILQCLVGESAESIEKLIITASGGPFRTWTRSQLEQVRVEQALRHPNWSMGAKITIDSATMMNKGFEVIEAHWLFGVPAHRIDVLVHPQSIIHSMVQYVDGSVKAQLGLPDMNLPIHYALGFPNRRESSFQRLDLTTISDLHFSKPDTTLFPALALAYSALERGGTAPAILNAANEVAVALFLAEQITFMDIARIADSCLNAIEVTDHPSLDDILLADAEARQRASLAATTTLPTTL